MSCKSNMMIPGRSELLQMLHSWFITLIRPVSTLLFIEVEGFPEQSAHRLRAKVLNIVPSAT